MKFTAHFFVAALLALLSACSIRSETKDPIDVFVEQDLLDAGQDGQLDLLQPDSDVANPDDVVGDVLDDLSDASNPDLADPELVDANDLGNDAPDTGDTTDDLEADVTPPECGPGNPCVPSPVPCTIASCLEGSCVEVPAELDTPVADPVAGDCLARVCDGFGGEMDVPDDADLPDDLKECTQDYCDAGSVGSKPRLAGTPCTEDGGVMCDEGANCVACLVDSDCGTSTTLCTRHQCVGGACETLFQEAGWLLPDQTPSDCFKWVCNGEGLEEKWSDPSDVLVDGNDCTQDLCLDGSPDNPLLPLGTPCTQDGGTVCNSAGECVQCNTSADCPDVACLDEVCQPPDCTDGFLNGTETDKDCGGPECDPCDAGNACNQQSDCLLGGCLWGNCFPCGQDAFEPNPIPALAALLPGGTTTIQLCEIDKDWFQLPVPTAKAGLAMTLEDGDGLATYEVRLSDCSPQDPGVVLIPTKIGAVNFYAFYDLPLDAARCISVEMLASPADPYQDREAKLTALLSPLCVLDTDCAAANCPWGGPMAGMCETPIHPDIPAMCLADQDYSQNRVIWTAGGDLTGSLCDLGNGWGAEWDWWLVSDAFEGGLNLSVVYDDLAAYDRSFRLWLFDATDRIVLEFVGESGSIQVDPSMLKTSRDYWAVVTLDGGDGTHTDLVSYSLHRSLVSEYFVAKPGDLQIPFNRAAGTSEPIYGTSFPLIRTGTLTSTTDACNPLAAGSLTGAIALVRRGGCTYNVKAYNVQTASGVGMIVYNNTTGSVTANYGGTLPITISGGAITKDHGEALNLMLDSGPVTIEWMPGYTVVLP